MLHEESRCGWMVLPAQRYANLCRRDGRRLALAALRMHVARGLDGLIMHARGAVN